eukprot:gb/GFBE01015582.1/.p1 GENE.gb/GFBE01015582.1/~~gb/GFBE01015582.1/.p1  ORF type:complete len:990 (+),score=147.58 gb/GFBE01015582.1/:1-2970(+)
MKAGGQRPISGRPSSLSLQSSNVKSLPGRSVQKHGLRAAEGRPQSACRPSSLDWAQFLDVALDPPKQLLITPRDEAIFKDLAESPLELRRSSTPTWSRLSDRSEPESPILGPSQLPTRTPSMLSSPTPSGSFRHERPQSSLAFPCSDQFSRRVSPEGAGSVISSLDGRCSPVDWSAADEEVRGIANRQGETVDRQAAVDDMVSKILFCLDADNDSSSRRNNMSYKDGLSAARHVALRNVMQIRPPSQQESYRLRGRAVPSGSRQAVIGVLRELFSQHGFQDRDVQVTVARPAHPAVQGLVQGSDSGCVDCGSPGKAFPRFEAIVLGRCSPLSRCCQSPVLIFFDVEYGLAVLCMKVNCEQPALRLEPLKEVQRLQIWGHWVRLNAGVLPKHKPPQPVRAETAPTPPPKAPPRGVSMPTARTLTPCLYLAKAGEARAMPDSQHRGRLVGGLDALQQPAASLAETPSRSILQELDLVGDAQTSEAALADAERMILPEDDYALEETGDQKQVMHAEHKEDHRSDQGKGDMLVQDQQAITPGLRAQDWSCPHQQVDENETQEAEDAEAMQHSIPLTQMHGNWEQAVNQKLNQEQGPEQECYHQREQELQWELSKGSLPEQYHDQNLEQSLPQQSEVHRKHRHLLNDTQLSTDAHKMQAESSEDDLDHQAKRLDAQHAWQCTSDDEPHDYSPEHKDAKAADPSVEDGRMLMTAKFEEPLLPPSPLPSQRSWFGRRRSNTRDVGGLSARKFNTGASDHSRASGESKAEDEAESRHSKDSVGLTAHRLRKWPTQDFEDKVEPAPCKAIAGQLREGKVTHAVQALQEGWSPRLFKSSGKETTGAVSFHSLVLDGLPPAKLARRDMSPGPAVPSHLQGPYRVPSVLSHDVESDLEDEGSVEDALASNAHGSRPPRTACPSSPARPQKGTAVVASRGLPAHATTSGRAAQMKPGRRHKPQWRYLPSKPHRHGGDAFTLPSALVTGSDFHNDWGRRGAAA